MNPIELCKSCGEAFDRDEMADGVCMQCSEYYENSERVPLDFEDKPKLSLDELYQKIDMTGDCV